MASPRRTTPSRAASSRANSLLGALAEPNGQDDDDDDELMVGGGNAGRRLVSGRAGGRFGGKAAAKRIVDSDDDDDDGAPDPAVRSRTAARGRGAAMTGRPTDDTDAEEAEGRRARRQRQPARSRGKASAGDDDDSDEFIVSDESSSDDSSASDESGESGESGSASEEDEEEASEADAGSGSAAGVGEDWEDDAPHLRKLLPSNRTDEITLAPLNKKCAPPAAALPLRGGSCAVHRCGRAACCFPCCQPLLLPAGHCCTSAAPGRAHPAEPAHCSTEAVCPSSALFRLPPCPLPPPLPLPFPACLPLLRVSGGRYVLWKSPDGSVRMRFNESTLRTIALRFGEWRQPPHFRTPMEAGLRRQLAAKFGGKRALALPKATDGPAQRGGEEDERFFERLREWQVRRARRRWRQQRSRGSRGSRGRAGQGRADGTHRARPSALR